MNRLKKCNCSLLVLAPLVLASSIILEASHGEAVLGVRFNIWVAAHIALAATFIALVFWHLKLNWGKISGWPKRLSSRKSGAVKALSILCFLTAATGIVAVPVWLLHGHTPIGGIHGKAGFIFLLLAILHTIRHRRWFRK